MPLVNFEDFFPVIVFCVKELTEYRPNLCGLVSQTLRCDARHRALRVTVRRELLLHAEVSKFDFKQMNGRPCGHIYYYCCLSL